MFNTLNKNEFYDVFSDDLFKILRPDATYYFDTNRRGKESKDLVYVKQGEEGSTPVLLYGEYKRGFDTVYRNFHNHMDADCTEDEVKNLLVNKYTSGNIFVEAFSLASCYDGVVNEMGEVVKGEKEYKFLWAYYTALKVEGEYKLGISVKFKE